MDVTYHTVLTDHGLRAHAATDEEKALATEVAQLRALLADGDCAHDVATLRNLQAQRRKVVDEAIKWVESPACDYDGGWGPFLAAVAEYKRITGRKAGDDIRAGRCLATEAHDQRSGERPTERGRDAT